MATFKFRKGSALLLTLIFSSIAVIMIVGLTSWFAVNLKSVTYLTHREQALQIAEAGIDYYRWHLAHNRTDFTDGTGLPGPYTHAFKDKDGNKIGDFILTITPPITGSTLVTIQSQGKVDADPNISRKIRTQLAIPSFAKFAVVANAHMRFGEGTEVFGPIHSNGGIRFDGLAHNTITSALSTYTDPDGGVCGGTSWAVHTCVSPQDPTPPAAVPNRPDIFESGRQFPVPATDFTGITTDLAQMKAQAQANGRYFAGSGSQGYRLVLKTNDTFDLYRVNNIVSSSCTPNPLPSGWGTWSIQNQTLIGNYGNPANGIIFLEDHVWVEGKINTARLTIAAGRFPDNVTTRKSIIINNDLLYTNYDGQDVIALIAQDNINVGLKSEDDLRIDAALIAQNGRVGRYSYTSGCGSEYRRDVLTLYGMIGTHERYGFAYVNTTTGLFNNGYESRNIIYDAHLLYGPPPSFPLTTDQYQILSWEEIE